MDPFDSTVEIYAVFEGSQSYDSARSKQYDVSVQEQTYTQSSSQPPSQSSSQSESQYTPPQNTFRQTSLSLKIPYTTVNAGDVLPISGKLIDSSGRALENGVTKEEIAEIVTHMAYYTGWPAAMTAAQVALDVYEAESD